MNSSKLQKLIELISGQYKWPAIRTFAKLPGFSFLHGRFYGKRLNKKKKVYPMLLDTVGKS